MSEPTAHPAEPTGRLDPLDRDAADPQPEPSPDGGAPAAAEPALPRPRIRVGAALWGLVLIAAACAALWLGADPAHRRATLAAVLDLSPFAQAVVLVIVLGATITLISLAAVLRRLQRRR